MAGIVVTAGAGVPVVTAGISPPILGTVTGLFAGPTAGTIFGELGITVGCPPP